MKKTILIFLKAALSISILVFIFYSLNFNKTLEILQKIDVSYLLVAFLVLIIQTILASYRWKYILQIIGFHYSFLEILHYLWIGIFCNQVLPSSIGGDAVRGYYLYKKGNTVKTAAISILLDRISGIMGLVILYILTIPFLYNKLENSSAQLGIILVGVSVILLTSAFFLLDMLPKKWSKANFFKGLFTLSFKGRQALLSSNSGLRLFVKSLTIHFLSIVAVIILSESLNLNINWLNLFLVVPLTALFMILPVSIAGWGVREGVMVIGLGYLGVVPEEALALSILFGLLMLFFAIPGGILWFLDSFFRKTSS